MPTCRPLGAIVRPRPSSVKASHVDVHGAMWTVDETRAGASAARFAARRARSQAARAGRPIAPVGLLSPADRSRRAARPRSCRSGAAQGDRRRTGRRARPRPASGRRRRGTERPAVRQGVDLGAADPTDPSALIRLGHEDEPRQHDASPLDQQVGEAGPGQCPGDAFADRRGDPRDRRGRADAGWCLETLGRPVATLTRAGWLLGHARKREPGTIGSSIIRTIGGAAHDSTPGVETGFLRGSSAGCRPREGSACQLADSRNVNCPTLPAARPE